MGSAANFGRRLGHPVQSAASFLGPQMNQSLPATEKIEVPLLFVVAVRGRLPALWC